MLNGAGRLALFEQDRLDLFDSHGFDGEVQWLTDSVGRRTAAVVGGEGERPVLLVHGALSQARGWALVAGKLRRRLVMENAAAVRLQTIDGAGHLLTFEEPDIVAETVTDFLGSNG